MLEHCSFIFEGVIRTVAVNVSRGGNSSELDELVRSGVVKVHMREQFAFYHFPNMHVEKTMHYDHTEESRSANGITAEEHTELAEGMKAMQTQMQDSMGPGVFDQVNGFDVACSSGMNPPAAPPTRPMSAVRDDLKLLSVKLSQTIKTVHKANVRAELALEDGKADGLDEHVKVLNEIIEQGTAHASCVQFAGEFGKSLKPDEIFTAALGEQLNIEGNALVTSLFQCTKVVSALVPKKEKASPKKKAKATVKAMKAMKNK